MTIYQVVEKVGIHNIELDGWGFFGNVLDSDMVNQHLYATKIILQAQRNNTENALRKEDLNSDTMK